VASFYLDHDVSIQLQLALEAFRHDVVTTRDLRDQRANDAEQLHTAARAGRVLVTHNRVDFALLHQAWCLWPAPLQHSGILVIPQQRWSATEAAAELDGFIRTGLSLINALYIWTPSRGWISYE
jgi:hypothetical protein